MPASAITIAILAMGGEGGGVLADWIVDLAERAGYYAQTTSVPGVAQRTGSTIYYLELFLADAANDAGREPVLALMPVPGELDIVIASELMEAGRAIQRGLVTPDRTTLIASTHRVYSMTEKTAAADGRVDSAALIEAGAAAAETYVRGDFERIAEDNRSVISAVLFGALAGAGALPFPRSEFEDAIRRAGVGVDSSLSAFAAGFIAAGEPPVLAATPRAGGPNAGLTRFPAAAHESLGAGVTSADQPLQHAATPPVLGRNDGLAQFPAAAHESLGTGVTSADPPLQPAATLPVLGRNDRLVQFPAGTHESLGAGVTSADQPLQPAAMLPVLGRNDRLAQLPAAPHESLGAGVTSADQPLQPAATPPVLGCNDRLAQFPAASHESLAGGVASADQPPKTAATTPVLGRNDRLVQFPAASHESLGAGVTSADQPLQPAATPRAGSPNTGLVQFPAACHSVLAAGIDRLSDYQDSRHATEYLEMLYPIRDADVQHGNGVFTLLCETGRYLALWMSYEDAIRVAGLKTRSTRFERVRHEARAARTQIVRIHEFLHPGAAEIADIFPAPLGRWLLNTAGARRFVDRLAAKGKVIETTSLIGFLQLYALAALRPWRRQSLRWQREMAKIREWLSQIPALAAENYRLACEVAQCPRLVKGYGETHIDGSRRFDAIMAALPAARRRDPTAEQFKRLREAGLAGDDQMLADALRKLNGMPG